MAKSVVSGAAGFIGSHLVERLLNDGHEVAGVDCFTSYYARDAKEANLAGARANERFSFIEDDLCDADLGRLLQGANVVFHLAGQPGVRPSWGQHFGEYVQHNIAATQRLLEAARETQPRRFVFASSSSVYGDAEALPVSEEALPKPVSPYGVTKLAAEHLCTLYAQAYGVPAISLRLFTVYGPRQRPDMAIQRFLSAAARGEPVTLYGDGAQTRDFTYVDDVVDAFVQAAERACVERVVNVCGGSSVSINDLLTAIEETTERRLRVERQPAARGDARHTLGDNSRAQRALGFRPKVSLREGLAAQWAWVRGVAQRDPCASR